MPIEMGVWRLDEDKPRRLPFGHLPSEAELESMLEQDSSLLGQQLLVIGRQVRTPYNKWIDLLAMDSDGNLHLLELKRDRTPREVVAQILDYGSWVTGLDRESIIDIANRHLKEIETNLEFEQAFSELFGTPAPDELNKDLTMTIVASGLDESSERIVTYLRGFGVPINAVFFSYLQDGERRYLARSWLASDAESSDQGSGRKASKRAAWNGQDWFVTFGDDDARDWEDARRFGFVSAGGGQWYSRTLRSLPVGARVFVHIPKHGYVGVGETIGEAVPFSDAQVNVEGSWTPLADHDLTGKYQHIQGDPSTADEFSEYIVPVRWETTVPKSQAYWEKGMFANQNSAGKLRQKFTLDRLASHFNLEQE